MSDLYNRIRNLSDRQRQLLALQLNAREISEQESNTPYSGKKIVAYLVGNETFDSDQVRNHLKEKLPEYMVPSLLVEINSVPRLPNGKIDYNALPSEIEAQGNPQFGIVEASSNTEKLLAGIWEEVLNFSPVGIHDNFFEIGGDSILSIQIIAKARAAGLILAPNQLFEHQTIAELALFTESASDSIQAEQIVTGPMPLMPIHHWFFETKKTAPHHWNQAVVFNPGQNISGQILKKAVSRLAEYHDALRLSFSRENENCKAVILNPNEVQSFSEINLTGMVASQQEIAIRDHSKTLQSGFDLAAGSLFKACYFDCGGSEKNQLLLIAHHLIIDQVSWGILLEDLEKICRQLNQGKQIEMPAKTVSFQNWSEELCELAKSDLIKGELEFWKTQCVETKPFPVDFDRAAPFPESSVNTLSFAMDATITNAILKEANETYKTRPEELMIAALIQTIAEWTDEDHLCIGFEGHGRESVGKSLDLSRTIGWFTTYYPLRLKVDKKDSHSTLIKSVKEQLRQVKHKGAGYGMLRYLSEESGSKSGLMIHPPLIFNYLGVLSDLKYDHLGSGEMIFDSARHPDSEWHHLLEVNTMIDKGQLRMNWRYSDNLHTKRTVETLANRFIEVLNALTEHCVKTDSGNYTPSDFPEAGLNQDDLDQLLDQLNI